MPRFLFWCPTQRITGNAFRISFQPDWQFQQANYELRRVLKSLYTGWSLDWGFRRCFADGRNRSLVSSVAQATLFPILKNQRFGEQALRGHCSCTISIPTVPNCHFVYNNLVLRAFFASLIFLGKSPGNEVACTSEYFRRLEEEIPYWCDRAKHCLGKSSINN